MNVVVVGSGIAGLTAALHARAAGHAVTLVTKGALGDGCTRLAQGGVAGAYGADDSADLHAADTLAAGGGLSDPTAVAVLVGDASARIAELVARGVAFDRTPDGALLRGREAAHSRARIAHAGGDATGAAIARSLTAAVRAADIVVVEGAFLVDLVVDDHAVRGIRLLVDRAVTDIAADAVVLATGGAGQLYARTTNPRGATGDGIAAALRAGAAAADLEFVQFHPTVLDDGSGFLVSEAVRGEGAVLIDADGRRFAFDTHPDGELAPRDVVARAIARQAAAQSSPVRLDATAIGAEALARRFPTIDRMTRERGFDWSADPIPVTPAAHYLMGGVATDLDGRTSVPGLFAVGEVACTGTHGANRLASNSLLEGAVFGVRAAAALGAPWPSGPDATLLRASTPSGVSAGPVGMSVPEPRASVPFDRGDVQRLMWEHVGLLRSDAGLRHAVETLRAWSAASRPPRSVAEHEDANLLLLARATASAALARTDSVGSHQRDTVAAPVLETA
ncbi:L-aspartate oxidase [Microbacterium sp. H83]|uniref:L-aspartate oxidase n=1 Tax=Microbacterium sp. H83 TaxID=1827324 RepID=UPI0007F3893E|nr:L-aspartate oxidase [Microbacterium sp. H83]OAN33620.1 L-aspartate oxidase [Microbacterium sp. H83]